MLSFPWPAADIQDLLHVGRVRAPRRGEHQLRLRYGGENVREGRQAAVREAPRLGHSLCGLAEGEQYLFGMVYEKVP